MYSQKTLLKHPSAFLPLAMSFAALTLVLGHIVVFGITRQADEGAAVHIWQLLMAGQVLIITLFAIKYLPKNPKQALKVIVLQIIAALTACAPVFLLKL